MTTCHFTCETCNGTSFNNCLSCLSSHLLINSVCQCQSFSDPVCSSNYLMNYYVAFDFLQTFFTLYLVFVAIMYMLNVKLKYTYRIFSVFQMISFALNMNIYFIGQTEYFLRIMYRTNGGFLLTNRFSTFSIQNAVCSAISVSVLIIIFFSQYWLSITYMDKSVDKYEDYLLNNIYKLLETIYFFQGKYFVMFFVQTISHVITTSVMDSSLGPAVIQLIVIVFQMGLTIYMYKKQKELHPTHYPKHFSLYLNFAPLTMIFLPILPAFQWIIYLIPLGLLILVLIIGREEQFDRWIALIYISEVIFYCLPLGVVFIQDAFKALYCLIIGYTLLILCIVECAIKYFSENQVSSKVSEKESVKSNEPTLQNIGQSSAVDIGIK